MLAVEQAALYLAAAAYTEPEAYGPMIGALLPTSGLLPKRARKTFDALSAAGVRVGKLDYAAFDLTTASDGFANEMRHLDSNSPEHGLYGRNTEVVESWARRIRNWADSEALYKLLKDFPEEASGTKPVSEVAAALIAKIEDVAKRANLDRHSLSDAVDESIEQLEMWLSGKPGNVVSTGLPPLDDIIDGYPIGETTMVFGRTGGLKSAFLVNDLCMSILGNTERDLDGGIQYVFTAEMKAAQLIHRAASRLSAVSFKNFRPKRGIHPRPIREQEVARYRAALEFFRTSSIELDETSAPTPEYMYAQLKQADARHGVANFWVDYIEKVKCDGEKEDVRIANAAKALKALAKTMNVPAIVLGQYNRKAENAYSRPREDWIKASSTIEQEAHTILHIHWMGWFAKKDIAPMEVWPESPVLNENDVYIICNKNRGGDTGMKQMHFEPSTGVFSEAKTSLNI